MAYFDRKVIRFWVQAKLILQVYPNNWFHLFVSIFLFSFILEVVIRAQDIYIYICIYIYIERERVKGIEGPLRKAQNGDTNYYTKRLPSILWWRKCMSYKDTVYLKNALGN